MDYDEWAEEMEIESDPYSAHRPMRNSDGEYIFG